MKWVGCKRMKECIWDWLLKIYDLSKRKINDDSSLTMMI